MAQRVSGLQQSSFRELFIKSGKTYSIVPLEVQRQHPRRFLYTREGGHGMAHKGAVAKSGKRGKGQDVPTIFCKLFTDMVTEHLCAIRRRELNARGGFSCEGCSMEQRRGEKCTLHGSSLPA